MKTKMRPRYYCDHCGKGNGSPSYMRRHESGCTLNPNRTCGMCHDGRIGPTKTPAELLEILNADGFAALCKAVGDCPACILAALRPLNVIDPELGPVVLGPQDGRQEWSFKDAKRKWWDDINEARAEKERY